MRRITLLMMMLFFVPFVVATDQMYFEFDSGNVNLTYQGLDCSYIIGETGDACNIGAGGGTYLNGTGLDLTGSTFSILARYRLPQTCSNGQVPSWNSTSGTWSTCLAPSGSGTVTSITRGYGFNDSGTSITSTGTLNINSSVIQKRVSGTCSAGSSIRVINQDGSVDCETDTSGSDSQTLSYDAPTDVISISGGNSIDISEVDTDTTCGTYASCANVVYTADLDYYTDADIDGSETAFDGWDKDASNDLTTSTVFSGNVSGLYNNLQVLGVNCSNIIQDGGGSDSDFCTDSTTAGAGAFDLNITSDSGSGTIEDSEILTFTGGTSIATSISGNTLTIDFDGSLVDTNETERVNTLVQNNISTNARISVLNTTTAIEALGFVTGAHTIDTNESTRVTALIASNASMDSRVDTLESNDPSDWDAIGDVPTATPSNGDTTHLSTADQIYDWVASNPFSWITTATSSLANYYLKTEIDTQGEVETIWGVSLATDTELASQDECSEISGCVVGAITDGNTNWGNDYNLAYTTGDNFTGHINMTGYNITNIDYLCIQGGVCFYGNGTHTILE